MIYLFIALWLIIGFLSIIYWWTDTQPLEVQDLLMIILASILGVFAFVIFAMPLMIDGTWFKGELLDKTIIKARDKRTKSMRTGRYERYTNDEWPGEANDIDVVTFHIEREEAGEGIYHGVSHHDVGAEEGDGEKPLSQQGSS